MEYYDETKQNKKKKHTIHELKYQKVKKKNP